MSVLADPYAFVEPAYRSLPPSAVDFSDAEMVIDLCDMVGFSPDPEQELGLRMLFGRDAEGRTASFEAAVICARQNMKTGLFKQAALGWLFVTSEKLIVWSAHEFPTAREAFRDMTELIMETPFLAKRVKDVYTGSGQERIELSSGQRLIFRARTYKGGRGLTGNRVVLDEAFALTEEHMGALLPTLSAVSDPQVVYGSSAGLPESEVLRGIRDRGRAGSSPRQGYLEWLAEPRCELGAGCGHDRGTPGCTLDDKTAWKSANPLLGRLRPNGTGMTVEHVLAEREALPPAEFARERMGWWEDPDLGDSAADTQPAFEPSVWAACFGEIPADYEVGSVGVATSFGGRQSAIVLGARSGDRVLGLPAQHGDGTSWVVTAAVELAVEHRVPIVLDKGGPAGFLLHELEKQARAKGVRVRGLTFAQAADAAALLDQYVESGRLLHGCDGSADGGPWELLQRSVESATRRASGDRWLWGRKPAKKGDAAPDITPLEATTVALWGLGNGPARSRVESNLEAGRPAVMTI